MELTRRGFLNRTVALAAWPLLGRAAGQETPMVDDPYAEVDWAAVEYLHSMSHQHGGQTAESLDQFHAMGYRHLAFTNYYPSAPTAVPDEWLAAHPDALECPNAEHHSFTDSFTHCNGLGSRTSTGAGWMGIKLPAASPFEHTFVGTKVYEPEPRPWDAVYRLDLKLADRDGGPAGAKVWLAGGLRTGKDGDLVADGRVEALPWDARLGSLTFRATAPEVTVRLEFDPATTAVTQFRLMQGSNRPWRDVFRACLDGEMIDGERVGGLEFADGGGMTINHPSSDRIEHFLELLDFDPRVLGIEVFNHLTTGFGSPRGFYDEGPGPHLHFYRLWDRILGTGRRCLGFFVKDHQNRATGRNVLLVPPPAGRSREERRHDALRAYRRGAFFGCLGAIATDDTGATVPPYDFTEFRFTRHELQRDAAGVPVRLVVEVAGNDPARRPQVQIRFVADGEIAQITDGSAAVYDIPRQGGRPGIGYVRAEAFAYPAEVRGEPLTPARLAGLNVAEIQRLHEFRVAESVYYRGGGAAGDQPVGVVDLIFGMPTRFR